MRAAIYHGQGDIRIEEIDEPSIDGDEVLIDVAACGICGSDLHEYAAGPSSIPAEEPHPVTGERAPLPIGHEFGGEVIDVGETVDTVSVGDVVAVNPLIPCGDCQNCENGYQNLCTALAGIGISTGTGGFSERIAVPAGSAVRFPDNLPPEYAALVEPFSVGLHAVRRSELSPGDSVAVFGTGPIGLTVVQAATVAGARTIYAVEPQDARREAANEAGADVVIDPTETDAVAEIREASSPGVDVTFEVAGVEQTVQDAFSSARTGGNVTIVSLFEDTVEIDPNQFATKELSVTGAAAYQIRSEGGAEFTTVPQFFADGSLDPEPLVSTQIDLDDIVADGFEALIDEGRNEIKILVTP